MLFEGSRSIAAQGRCVKNRMIEQVFQSLKYQCIYLYSFELFYCVQPPRGHSRQFCHHLIGCFCLYTEHSNMCVKTYGFCIRAFTHMIGAVIRIVGV